MAWNAASPDGSKSVKFNRTQMNANNDYIQATMGNSVVGTNTVATRDHFWDVGSNEDGRHRFMQSPAFTVGGNPDDPVVGTEMNGVLYLKTTNNRAEWFHRNVNGIYQAVPSFLSGTKSLPGTYTNVVEVPANVYGEIFMYTTAQGRLSTVTGFFRSAGTTVEAWALRNATEGSTDLAVKFANGNDATGLLNIRARAEAAANDQQWNYRITYRAL